MFFFSLSRKENFSEMDIIGQVSEYVFYQKKKKSSEVFFVEVEVLLFCYLGSTFLGSFFLYWLHCWIIKQTDKLTRENLLQNNELVHFLVSTLICK